MDCAIFSKTCIKLRSSSKWKYIVLVAAVISCALTVGFHFGVAGSLTIAQAHHFNITTSESSWTASSMSAAFQCLAPLAAILTRMVTKVTAQMAAATLVILAMSMSYFVTEFWQIVLLFGALTGFGNSILRNVACAMVKEQFDDDMINFALTVVQTGFYIGLIVYSTLAEYAFTHFDFKYALFIIASTMFLQYLNGIAFTKKISHLNMEGGGNPSPEKRDEEYSMQSIWKSTREVYSDSKVWCFAMAGFFKGFAMTAFFTLVSDYMVEMKGLKLEQATEGTELIGYIGVGGVIFMCCTFKLDYDRVIPHVVAPLIYGVAMILVTESNSQATYMLLMAVYGIANGIHLGNHLALANQLGGHNNMIFVYSLDQSMQGIGCLLGGPVSGFLEEHVTSGSGMYLSGFTGIMSGIMAATIWVTDCVKRHKEMVKRNSFPKMILVNKNEIKPKYDYVPTQPEKDELQPLI